MVAAHGIADVPFAIAAPRQRRRALQRPILDGPNHAFRFDEMTILAILRSSKALPQKSRKQQKYESLEVVMRLNQRKNVSFEVVMRLDDRRNCSGTGSGEG